MFVEQCGRITTYAVVAQLVEHLHGKEKVTGPIPVNGSMISRLKVRTVFTGRCPYKLVTGILY